MAEVTANAIEKLLKIINIDEKLVKLCREIEVCKTKKDKDSFSQWQIPKYINSRQKKIRELSKIRADIKKSLRHDIFIIKKDLE